MRVNMGEVGDVLFDDLEGLLREINEFSATGSTKPEDIPQSLDRYLQFVAKSGNIVFPWQHVRLLFRIKILQAMEQFPGEACPNSEAFVMERFDLFRSAPFTIQRLTELVMQPTRHYKKKEKFLRGLEKTVLVVSTIEPWSLDADMKNGNDSGSDGEMDQTYSESDDSIVNNRTYDMDNQDKLVQKGQESIEPLETAATYMPENVGVSTLGVGAVEMLQQEQDDLMASVDMHKGHESLEPLDAASVAYIPEMPENVGVPGLDVGTVEMLQGSQEQDNLMVSVDMHKGQDSIDPLETTSTYMPQNVGVTGLDVGAVQMSQGSQEQSNLMGSVNLQKGPEIIEPLEPASATYMSENLGVPALDESAVEMLQGSQDQSNLMGSVDLQKEPEIIEPLEPISATYMSENLGVPALDAGAVEMLQESEEQGNGTVDMQKGPEILEPLATSIVYTPENVVSISGVGDTAEEILKSEKDVTN